jgi:hypothetical protein
MPDAEIEGKLGASGLIRFILTPGGAARVVVRARESELIGFELTEFEAPSNPARRAHVVQTVIRMIEPVFLAGTDRGKRLYDPCA